MSAESGFALRWLLYLAAGVVITLALLVGLLRLLLPLVPDYQDDIRAWAGTATGYDIGFQRISASWPLSGPELSFYDVSLTRPGDSAAVFKARELSAGISLLRLLRDFKPTLSHLAVSGTAISVERTPDGELLVQGRRLEDLLPKMPANRNPQIELDLENVAVTYLDTQRGPEPQALNLQRLTADLTGDELSAQADVILPKAYGRKLRIEVQAPLPLPSPLAVPADWTASMSGTGLDVVRILAYALGDTAPLRSGVGDLSIDIASQARQTHLVAARFDLSQVEVGSATEATAYEGLAGQFKWQRNLAGWDVAFSDLRVRRGGRESPKSAGELHYQPSSEAAAEQWRGRAGFLRLDDLYPVARALTAGTEFGAGLPRSLRGDVKDLEIDFSAQAEEPTNYSLRLGFDRLGVTTASGEVRLDGLTGTLAADGDGGRLQLASRDVGVELSQWFRDALKAEQLKGLLIWRATPSGVRFLSDDISVTGTGINIRSRVELEFPAGSGSPIIDLKATASATQAREVLRYLPLRGFPPKIVDWLERAVVAGQVPRAIVEFNGPLREFPYDHGEGVFRVNLDLKEATLDYANGWPRIEALDADVVFDGVSVYSTKNRAQIANLKVRDYSFRIADLRRGVVALSGRQRFGVDEILTFVRATPVSRALGPMIERVSGDGPVDTALRLALPLPHPTEYDLKVLFDPRGCRVAMERLPLELQDLRGRVRLQNTHFTGDGLSAVMLGEPVTISIHPETAPNSPVSHTAEFQGATPVPMITSTFKLPLPEYFDGRVGWQATVRVPARHDNKTTVPLSVAIRSDLVGMTSTLPPPLAKTADIAWPASAELRFLENDLIDITGRLDPPFAWALRLASSNSNWRVERGALRAGPGDVRLPQRRGVEITGQVAQLRLADWLDLGKGGRGSAARDLYRDVTLQIGVLAVAGQVFRDVNAAVRRGPDGWSVDVKGPRVEGLVSVPFDTAGRPLILNMKRLWLLESEQGGGGAPTDPRDAMAAEVKAEDAAIGAWHFGSLDMSVEKAPDGLVATRIATRAKSFQIDGDAAWRVEPGADGSGRQHTRLQAKLKGTDIKATLEQLGYDPVMAGAQEQADVNLEWPDGPTADFMSKASGRIAIEMKNGQVLDVNPGGSGRLLGLLSVTALPRRLALDFRDVFNEGMAFDTIKGDFRVASGSAYTCNLGLTGPVADVGIVGRTGLGNRDYEQLAVVRPKVSNMLAVGGVVLGGPVGGATMLLISQIFRKPLSTLGESYYQVSGDWDKPTVVRVQRSEVNAAPFKDCEKEVAEALQAANLSQPPAIPEESAAPAAPPAVTEAP